MPCFGRGRGRRSEDGRAVENRVWKTNLHERGLDADRNERLALLARLHHLQLGLAAAVALSGIDEDSSRRARRLSSGHEHANDAAPRSLWRRPAFAGGRPAALRRRRCRRSLGGVRHAQGPPLEAPDNPYRVLGVTEDAASRARSWTRTSS